jgi:hypothetical protein
MATPCANGIIMHNLLVMVYILNVPQKNMYLRLGSQLRVLLAMVETLGVGA